MEKKIISLHGSYFFNNYGDTLLVNIFAKWITDCVKDVELNLPMVKRKKIREMPGNKSGLLNLAKSKALIFCGGGYFGEQPREKYRWALRNFYRHGIVGLVAILFHIPYAIIGVEFGPITARWFRKFVVYLAKNASVVVVRNKESVEFLNKYGVENVELAADAVLSLSETISPKTLQTQRPVIALHIPFIQLHRKQYLDFVKYVVSEASATFHDYKILLINDGTYNVYKKKSYEEVIQILKEAKVEYEVPKYTGCYDFAELINNCNYLFTTKLHVGITGAALNKRVFSLYTHPKSVRLHSQIGNGYYCEPVSAVSEHTQNKIKEFFREKTFVLPSEIIQDSLYNRKALQKFLAQTL